jgi:ferredoxin
MIEITVDKDACVGCTLCVDECPTDVFEFNDKEAIPEVKKPGECFGCLSCSEICPSDAISHSDLIRSEDHYHDSYNLRMASLLSPAVQTPKSSGDPASEQRAMNDLGVRLLAVAAVFRQTLGGSLPAVGTMAGRTLATQLPRYQVPECFQDVLDQAVLQFAPTWNLKPSLEPEGNLTVHVGDCYIRELCKGEGIELGGDLCVLFYNYLAGYLGRMGDARLKLQESNPGDRECRYRVQVIPKS